jgi:hypothetical protein
MTRAPRQRLHCGLPSYFMLLLRPHIEAPLYYTAGRAAKSDAGGGCRKPGVAFVLGDPRDTGLRA